LNPTEIINGRIADRIHKALLADAKPEVAAALNELREAMAPELERIDNQRAWLEESNKRLLGDVKTVKVENANLHEIVVKQSKRLGEAVRPQGWYEENEILQQQLAEAHAAISRFAAPVVAGVIIQDENANLQQQLAEARATVALLTARNAELQAACAESRATLRNIWDNDDMGWLTENENTWECGECGGEAETPGEVVHQEGCVQGLIANAVWKLERVLGLDAAEGGAR